MRRLFSPVSFPQSPLPAPLPPRRVLRVGLAAVCLSLAGLPAVPAFAQAPAAVQQQLRAESAQDPDLAAFYRSRGYRPLWIRGDDLIGESRRLVDRVQDIAGSRSLDALMLADAVRAARSGDPQHLAMAEVRLTSALLAYVGDRPVETGMVYVDEELAPRKSERLPSGPINSPRDIRERLEALEEVNPVERDLLRGLANYRSAWSHLPDVTVPSGSTLRPGARGSRVQALRRRLGLPAGNRFDSALAQTVRAWKAAHGLPADSNVDARTITALNRGPAHYERLIRANIARARALPTDPGRRFILVDTASQTLTMYERGRPVDSMRVIVGKPDHQTPMMAAFIRYAALNPYWNVPPDLARDNIAPNALRLGRSWVEARGYEVLSNWTNSAHVIPASQVDWRAIASGRQPARVRQRPGPENMMGRVKLMLPNRMGIYLHDTPDRHLFGNSDLRQSSGCVRLEDAARLTRWVFGGEVRPRTGQPEERVDLRRPVPVFITYLTAWPTGAGTIAFRPDVYERDADLLARMTSRSGVRRAAN